MASFVRTWSGKEARALRHALRMSVRDFAKYIGVSPRTISKWELPDSEARPGQFNQRSLDIALARTDQDVRDRFRDFLDSPPPHQTYESNCVKSIHDAPLPSFDEPDVRKALAKRDIATLYRLLQRAHISQRRIAALTGQSQSEVSEILSGRQVTSYDLLVRIADGLGIERGYMGLAYDDSTRALGIDEYCSV